MQFVRLVRALLVLLTFLYLAEHLHCHIIFVICNRTLHVIQSPRVHVWILRTQFLGKRSLAQNVRLLLGKRDSKQDWAVALLFSVWGWVVCVEPV